MDLALPDATALAAALTGAWSPVPLHPLDAALGVLGQAELDHPADQLLGDGITVGKGEAALAGLEPAEFVVEGLFGAGCEGDVGVAAVSGEDEHDHAVGVDIGRVAPLELLGAVWGGLGAEPAQVTQEPYGRLVEGVQVLLDRRRLRHGGSFPPPSLSVRSHPAKMLQPVDCDRPAT